MPEEPKELTKDDIRKSVYDNWDYFGTKYDKRGIGWMSPHAAINTYFTDQQRYLDDLFAVGMLRKEITEKQAIEKGEYNRTYRNTRDPETRAMLDGISALHKEGHSPEMIVAMMQLSENSLQAVRRHVGLDPIPYDDGKRSPVQNANPVIADMLKRIGKPFPAQGKANPNYNRQHQHIDLSRVDTDPRGG